MDALALERECGGGRVTEARNGDVSVRWAGPDGGARLRAVVRRWLEGETAGGVHVLYAGTDA